MTPAGTPLPSVTPSPSSLPPAVSSATPFPPRVRGINNNYAQDTNLYLCFTSTAEGAKNATVDLEDQYEFSEYEEISAGTFSVSVTTDSKCQKVIDGPFTAFIGGSTLVSYQNDTFNPLVSYPEPFYPPSEVKNMTQVFVVVQELGQGQTGATVSFALKADDAVSSKNVVSRFFMSSNTVSAVVANAPNTPSSQVLSEGDYTITIELAPSGNTSTKDVTFKGGDYFSLAVNYDLSVETSDEGGSGGSDWLLWVVIAIAAIIVLVVFLVGGVIIFRHFKNRSQYDVIGDDATASDDYKFQ